MAKQLVNNFSPPPASIRMSYEEWLDWAPEDRLSEWVDGEAIPFMPPLISHQLVVGFVYELLAGFVRRQLLGLVLVAPFEMRLARSAREPDVAFVAKHHLHRIEDDRRLKGGADLVVEVISNDSVARDRREKAAEYVAAGISEYWLIDPRPRRRSLEVLPLNQDGTYAPAQPDDQGRLHSLQLPGLWVDPSWLWQEPRPEVLSLLQQITAALEQR